MKIEKNIPPPVRSTAAHLVDDFDAMEVGDSAFLDGLLPNSPEMSNLRARATRKGRKIITAREGSGVRLWRVS